LGKFNLGYIKHHLEGNMNSHTLDANKSYSLLGRVEGAEKAFLSDRRNREEDLESAVMIFLEF